MENNTKVGEIDYAILKSIDYDVKNLMDIVKVLQIRTILIEKHIYVLVKDGFIIFQFDHYVITPEGENAILSFERENSENTINKFIVSSVKLRKEQKIKAYKTVQYYLFQ